MRITRFIKNFAKRLPTYFFKLDDKIFEDLFWVVKLKRMYKSCFFYYPTLKFLEIYANEIKILVNEENKKEFSNNVVKNLQKIDDDSKMFLLDILYFSKVFTDSIVEEYFKYAKETNNSFFRNWFTMDISRMTFLLQKGFYSNYYLDRKVLLKEVFNDCDIKIPEKKDIDDRKKLCIVTFWLEPSIYNSVQRVLMMAVDGLKKYYDDILIVSTENFLISKRRRKKALSPYARIYQDGTKEKIQEMFGNDVRVELLKDVEYKERYQKALDIIYNYNPTTILDISDEYSVISYAYSKDYPTFYLPLRSNASSSFFKYILADEVTCKKINQKYKSIEDNQICPWIFPEYVPVSNKKYTREECKFSDNDFIIITIGNNDKVIDANLAYEMNLLLKKNNNFKWLLVGGNAPEFMHRDYEELFENKRIIEWGFEKELASICKICDVTLRPNTTGSSGATAIAAQQGLPIVMTNFLCDPMRWLGTDYSQYETYSQLMLEIEKLYEDKEYYEKIKEKVLRKVNDATDENKKWFELYEIMNRKSVEGR